MTFDPNFNIICKSYMIICEACMIICITKMILGSSTLHVCTPFLMLDTDVIGRPNSFKLYLLCNDICIHHEDGIHTWWVELPSLILVMRIIMQALHVYILSGLTSNHLCWLFYLQLNVSFRMCISHFFEKNSTCSSNNSSCS